MQPGRHQAEPLHRNAGAPGLGAVGAEQRHGLALAQAGRRHGGLHAPDQRQGRAIGQAAAVPGEGGASGKRASERIAMVTTVGAWAMLPFIVVPFPKAALPRPILSS